MRPVWRTYGASATLKSVFFGSSHFVWPCEAMMQLIICGLGWPALDSTRKPGPSWQATS